MKPLIVLISVFIIALLIIEFLHGKYDVTYAGRIALSAMLLFTASGHFLFSKGMVSMIPKFLPCKITIVYLTGFIEIAAALVLHLANLQLVTGWLLIAFFLVIFPANIYSSIKHIDYQKNTTDGNGLRYLWFRIPLQLFFIVWTYFSTIK